MTVVLIGVVVIVGSVIAVALMWPRPPDFAVRIIMPESQCWSGNLTVDESRSPETGCGTVTLDVRDDCETIVAIFKKDASTQGSLLVEILENGSPVRSGEATSDGGTVAISHACIGDEPVM